MTTCYKSLVLLFSLSFIPLTKLGLKQSQNICITVILYNVGPRQRRWADVVQKAHKCSVFAVVVV